MAGSASTYFANIIMAHVFGKTTYTAPSPLYLAAYTSAPSDAGGGAEVTGGGYARVAITNNTTNFPAPVGGETNLGVVQSFPEATAGWGIITHFGILDAATNGNLIIWGALGTPQSIGVGDILRFPAGGTGLRLTCD